jgi:hypothetical protein
MVSQNRPRTPEGGASPTSDKLAPIPEGNNNPQGPRRSSLGLLLRRSKSGDLGSKGSKKRQAREAELARQREAAAISNIPPSLPALYDGATPPALQTFGGEDRSDYNPNMTARVSSSQSRGSMDPGRSFSPSDVPLPPIPQNGMKGQYVDPYARSESMTHRGRYSYASSAVSSINSPRRVRRRKDPTPFK